MVLTDSHAHLSSVAEALGADSLAGILEDYEAAAAIADLPLPLLVDPGTEPDDLQGRIALLEPAARSSFLRLAAGVWPAAESLASPPASLAVLESAIEAAGLRGVGIAAIGEGGLDYHHSEGSAESQAELFEGQLRLAARRALPMIVHSRDSASDTLALLGRRPGDSPAIIHCFGYGPEEAKAFLDAGCYLSFAGNLTYKSAASLREACALVPDDRILLETDAPYMNPMPLRGRPSSPRDIERTYALAAEIRRCSVPGLAETVSLNARTLFG